MTTLDRPSGVKLSVTVFGEFLSDCDAPTATQIGAVILEVFSQLTAQSADAAKLCGDPTSFPTVIEPAVLQALEQRGAPRVQLGSFTAALSPKSIAELKAAAARVAAVSATPAPRALAVGAAVLVAWNDGNRYGGTVQALGEGQAQVAFPDGAIHWIPVGFVELA